MILGPRPADRQPSRLPGGGDGHNHGGNEEDPWRPQHRLDAVARELAPEERVQVDPLSTGGDGAATGVTPFQRAVADVVSGLRPGDVVTYGEVAAEAGHPGAARAVGTFLRDSEGLPWWRVVRADGRLVSGHERRQRRLLAADGVTVAGNPARTAQALPAPRRRC